MFIIYILFNLMSTLKKPVTQLNDFCPPDAENYNDDGK